MSRPVRRSRCAVTTTASKRTGPTRATTGPGAVGEIVAARRVVRKGQQDPRAKGRHPRARPARPATRARAGGCGRARPGRVRRGCGARTAALLGGGGDVLLHQRAQPPQLAAEFGRQRLGPVVVGDALPVPHHLGPAEALAAQGGGDGCRLRAVEDEDQGLLCPRPGPWPRGRRPGRRPCASARRVAGSLALALRARSAP